MASFRDRMTPKFLNNGISAIARHNVTPETLLLNNSQAIGYIEGELKRRGAYSPGDDDLLSFSAAIADTTSSLHTKSLAFFQLDYKVKKEKLRDVAASSEIEFVLDSISNDTIVYDESNMFCRPFNISSLVTDKASKDIPKIYNKYKEKIIDVYNEAFYSVYDAWGFHDGVTAWKMFYQFLIEGNISYEIIYDDVAKPRQIIGFKELDPATIYPIVDKDTDGNLILKWIQRSPYDSSYRELHDNQIIYISYANSFKTKRVSFVERMIRSFNLLRIIEQSKVMWHIMMAPIRLKTTIPVGTKSLGKAKNDVKEFLNYFKEDIYFNNESGELLVEGKPKILYYKNYIVPENTRGEKIDIDTLEHAGPDLQDSQLLNYFLRKLKLDSKLPFSRWDYNEGGGSYLLGPDTVSREEITYHKMIKRFRATFQEIVVKPIYLQMCLDYPILKKDIKLKNLLSIRYTEENVFEEMKIAALAEQRVSIITKLLELQESPDSYFDMETLIKKYMKMTDEELIENTRIKERKAEGGEGGGGAEGGEGGGGSEMGGGSPLEGMGDLQGGGQEGGQDEMGQLDAELQGGAQEGGQELQL